MHHLQDLDLNPPKPVRLLAIAWDKVHLTSNADALALWQRIAPTGADWDMKLSEIPSDLPVAHQLAIALLRQGNFTCSPPPPPACSRAPLDVPAPAATATFADPCLRRMLALWSLSQLDEADLPQVHDALRAIAAIPPPESQLVASAIQILPRDDQDGRLELLGIAWRAGQHELVDSLLGGLDPAHLVAAAKLHIGGAIEILPAQPYRATFLAAIADEHMPPGARAEAMTELAGASPRLDRPLHAALLAASRSDDCTVAATAARVLDHHGDHSRVPRLPRTTSVVTMMRSMCVLASFERLASPDEPSYLPGYIPTRGLKLVTVRYDRYSAIDNDGDGDPHTVHTVEQIAPDQVVLPDLAELVNAMHHCTRTTCRGDDHTFGFTFERSGRRLLLAQLEVSDNPPCQDPHAISKP